MPVCMHAGCPAYNQTGYIISNVNCSGTQVGLPCTPGWNAPSPTAVSCDSVAGYHAAPGGISTKTVNCTNAGVWSSSAALSGCARGKHRNHSLTDLLSSFHMIPVHTAGPPPRLAEVGAGPGFVEGVYQPVLAMTVLIDTGLLRFIHQAFSSSSSLTDF